MPCTTTTFVDYTTNPASTYTKTVCWPDGENGDAYYPPAVVDTPPTGGTTAPNFGVDPSGGTVIVPDTSTPQQTVIDLNPGWNSGAFAVGDLPPSWAGTVSFDVPDVDGSRPAGVAVGFCPVSALPATYRNGYGHLQYGLVFVGDEVKVLHEGAEVATLSYPTVNSARTTPGTDLVQVALYGESIQWICNGIPLFGGPFAMAENYALDATLYLAFDRVDNPSFLEGEFPDLAGALVGVLPKLHGSIEMGVDGELVGDLPKLYGKLADAAYAELAGTLGALYGSMGVGDGLRGTIGPIIGYLSSSSSYNTLTGTIGPIIGELAGGPPVGVPYSVLAGALPRFVGYMTSPATGRIDSNLPRLLGRVTAALYYSELVESLPGLRGVAYGGGVTPLVQVTETVGYYASTFVDAYVTITAIEYAQATSTATVEATLTADGSEQITVQDPASVFATMLEAVAERIGLGERVSTLVFRIISGGLVDEGEAWVVNTSSSASTRYDAYGFNSFFVLAGKQYGVRQDGVYLLEGADDAGVPITAGVSLGKHDFGTQALKQMNAVYVGVSSSGKMMLRVNDGKNIYTYMARDAGPTLEAQRFDVGRGLRSNYFTFDLIAEGDTFELDNVTFSVASSQRKI